MEKIWREWKWVIVFGVLVLSVGFFIRIYNLTKLPIFVDEAIYIRWAQIMRNEASLRFLPLSDGKQPLFMWAVIPFLKIFSDPLFAGRIVSVLSGLATMVGIFVLSYNLFSSKKLSLISSLVYAISPFSVFFDRMALVDSMLSMFGIWSLFLGVLTAKTLRLDYAMLMGFILGGALLTKSPAIFFIVLLPFTLSFANRRKNLPKLVLLWLVSLGIAYGMYNILRLGPNFGMLSARNSDYIFPLSHVLSNPKDPFLPHIDRIKEYFLILGPSLGFFLAILGVFFGIKHKAKETIFLLIVFLLPIFVQAEYAKVFTARYVFFSVPLFAIFISLTLIEERKKIVKIFFGVFVLFLIQSIRKDYLLLTNVERLNLPRSERSGYLEEWTAGTGIREVAGIIRNNYLSSPKEKIVVGTEGYFGTLPDGLQLYLNDLRDITVIGVGLEFEEIPKSLLESKKFGNKTYLVVNSSRIKIKNFDLGGLKLISSYPKTFRPDGYKEFVRFGPRDYLYLFEVTGI